MGGPTVLVLGRVVVAVGHFTAASGKELHLLRLTEVTVQAYVAGGPDFADLQHMMAGQFRIPDIPAEI